MMASGTSPMMMMMMGTATATVTAAASASANASIAAAMTAHSTAPTASSLASLEWLYFKAVSLYRRRNYEKCVEVCNGMLHAGHESNVQLFAAPPDADDGNGVGGGGGGGQSGSGGRYGSNLQRIAPLRQGRRQNGSNNNINNSSSGSNNAAANKASMPTWMMEGVWQLKMRALTQRVYVDDLETDDAGHEEVELERIATAARPGTSIKTAFIPRPSTSTLRAGSATARSRVSALSGGAHSSEGRMATARLTATARPKSGIMRPGTGTSRPGSSLGSRPASRCGTASRIRATSAAAFTVGDITAKLYQASRLNPTIYAERETLIKALFQFLYYHESDVQKAYSLCEAVMEMHKQKRGADAHRIAGPVDWWWDQQMGRCLLMLRYPRKAEVYLVQSLAVFPHPDTYLLLSRLYQRLDQSERALELITMAVDRHPFDVTFRIEQGRIFDALSKPDDAMQIYRLITKLNPINIEALACIALNHFYENNPEMALMYYRRILSLGVHTAELYCNIALCCLYGGQIDLVLPCFHRALLMAKTPDQKADIWYNLSFVALSTGDFHLARRCLQLCLTADARNGAALNNLAVLAAHAGDLMRAKSYLNAAKEVLIDSSEVEGNIQYMEAHYKL